MLEERSLPELATRLKEKYRENATIERLFYPDRPLPIEQCYLDLALIEDKVFHDQKKVDQSNTREESRNYFLHSYERIQHSQRKLTPEQLLTECHTISKRIYIEGAAGAGKTTLSQFIAYQWGKDHPAWKHYDFLFRIRLRDLNVANYPEHKIDFIEFLEKECFLFGFSDSLMENEKNGLLRYLKSKTKKVLFILDGYDELSLENNVAIKALWKNLIQSDYDFIITSRPGMQKAELKTHLNVAILGFSDEQVEKYIKYFFDQKHTPDVQSHDANLCLQTFRKNSNLWSLAHTPIQLELLCSIWGYELNETPDVTLTGIYTLMLEQLLKRYELKRLDSEEHKKIILSDIDIEPLLENFTVYLESLENLAFVGMERSELVIPHKIIEEAYKALIVKPKDKANFFTTLKNLGLVTRDSDGRQMEFIHLTFQEYFAARYIVRCFRMQQVPKSYATLSEFIQQKKYHRHYEIVWQFVAGLLKNDAELLKNYFHLLQSEPYDLAETYQFDLQLHCSAEGELRLQHESKDKLLDKLISWIQQLFSNRDDNPLKRIFSLPTAIINQGPIINILSSIISHDARNFDGWYFKKLSNLPESILQLLIKQLSDKDKDVQFDVAWILSNQTLLPEAILQSLVTLLSHENENIQSHAAWVLSNQISLPEAILQSLVKLLSHNSELMQSNAVRALSNQTSLPEVILQSLVKLLNHNNKRIQSNSARALSNQVPLSEAMLQVMEKLLSDKNGTMLFYAAEALSNQTTLPETILQSLVKLLGHENESIQFYVAKILSKQTTLPKAILQSLVKLLRHSNKKIQSHAARALSERTLLPETILQSLEKLLSDKNENIQFYAAWALSKRTLLPEVILQSLVKLLSHNNKRIQSNVTRALSKQISLPETILQSLVKLLSHNSELIQSNVVRVLSNQTTLPEPILQSLVQLLGHKNESIQFYVAETLSKQTTLSEATLQSLVELLSHKNEDIQPYVAEVLSSQSILPEFILQQFITLLDIKNRNLQKILSFQMQLNKSILIVLGQIGINSMNILLCLRSISITNLCMHLSRYQWEAADCALLKLIVLKCLKQKVALYFYESTLYVGGEAQEGKFSSECQMKITQTLKQLFTEITGIPASAVTELKTDSDLQIKEKSENTHDLTVSKELMMQEQTKKYDVFLNEIKETTEAIDMLISHIDLKTKITQELQNISNELEKAKTHAAHINERIRLAAQTTYDGCINKLNYFKTIIAQEKNYPIDDLNQVITYVEDIIAKVSPKIELHSYSVTQMQEVQTQGLFFTQRYLHNALNELSRLGNDVKELLETIKTTMGANRYSCFISYAKPINETNGPDRFIQPFLETLRDHLLLAGFNALLDFKCVEAGESLDAYMKQALISNHWLLIGTPSLPQRLDQQAHVAFETRIETLRKINKLNNIYPMIPLLVVGNVAQSLPWYKQSHNTIDLTQNSYLAGLKKLLQPLSRIPEQRYNDLWKAFEAKYPEHMQALSASLVKQILQNEQQKEQLRRAHIENKQANVYQAFSQPITNAEVKSNSYSRSVSGVHMWQEDKKSDTSKLEGIHYEYKYHPEYKRSDIEFEIEDGCDPRVFNFIENLYQKNKSFNSQPDSIENINQRQFIETVLDHTPATNTNRPISSELKVHEANFSIKVKSKKSSSSNSIHNNNH